MQNFINYTNEWEITTSTTMGYLPGMLYPTALLICNAGAGITVTLPQTSTLPAVLPPASPGYGQSVDGVGGGYRITIFNQNGTAGVTVSAASTDQIVGTANVAGSANAKVTLASAPSLTSWYVVG